MQSSSSVPRNPTRPAQATAERHDRLLNVTEVATALRVSKMTVYRLVHDGRLPALRVGRAFRIRIGDLEAFLADAVRPVAV